MRENQIYIHRDVKYKTIIAMIKIKSEGKIYSSRLFAQKLDKVLFKVYIYLSTLGYFRIRKCKRNLYKASEILEVR